jgi:hypothetical protein
VVSGMRSSRLALVAVTVGTGLLGWSTVGVTAVAGNLAQVSDTSTVELRQDHREPDGGHGHAHGRHGDREGV